MANTDIQCVLFDFGGVIAEEGFRKALRETARRDGLDPDELPRLAMEAVYDSGFVLGRGSEADFWQELQSHAPVNESFEDFRDRVLAGFVVRPAMLRLADALRTSGITTAILSDQTHWLDTLDRRDGVFRHFDRVFNSFYLGKGKRDASLFDDVLAELRCPAPAALFIDDSQGHVQRAHQRGLRAILFEETADCIRQVRRMTGLD